MVPRAAFPPGAERTDLPRLRLSADGFVDTGYACRSDSMAITAPPPGLIGVGGYRFVARDLAGLIQGLDGSATLAALPDVFTGQRLAGAAADPDQVKAALTTRGENPLIAGAFGIG